MTSTWPPLLVLASSFLPGLFIFALPERRARLRTALNLLGAVSKLVFVGWMLYGVARDRRYGVAFEVLPGVQLSLQADALALLFVTLSAALWFLTTVYAVGYLEVAGAHNRSRFFGFFSLCVTATVGLAMSANLLTFFCFYELLTVSTWPLVVHRGTPNSLAAGDRYAAYTFGGGVVLLAGVAGAYALLGAVPFTSGGLPAVADPAHRSELTAIFVLLMLGLGVKTALVPLHGWLPRAMAAPAPVSALLHAVAVVKAGAFGIVRVVYEVYGVQQAHRMGLLVPLAGVAAVTVVWGSVQALLQGNVKRRLAYSTVSQVAFIVLGVAIVGPTATVGGLVHLVHQGLMKITMFFCAGNWAETLGIHEVRELDGVGRRMPLTTAAFTVVALAMVGLPPLPGYVTKHYLDQGALEAGMPWAWWVVTGSGLLSAAYLLPILWRAWLRKPPESWPDERIPRRGWAETGWLLLLPTVAAALATIVAGVFAEQPWSPLSWAKLVTDREYVP